MSNHTPGPWTIEKSTRTDHHIIAGRRWIATASNHDFHPTQEENERTIANAHLIAAAPDLLAALQTAENVLRYAAQESAGRVRREIVGGWLHHADQCRAAIAKATGEVKEES